MTTGLAVLALLFAARPASADFFIHHWEDQYVPFRSADLGGDLFYYSTSQNYDANGNTLTPSGTSSGAALNDYHRLGVDVLGRFGLFDRFSLFGRVSWARFQVDDTLASSSSYGFADQTIGADYRVLDASTIALDLQAQADVPAYGNATDQQSDSPFQGDGSVDLSLGGFIRMVVGETSSGTFSLLGGAGYTSRSDHYSAAIPWNLSASYEPKAAHSGWLASLSTLGLSSLGTDNSAAVPQSGIPGGFLTGSGGSFITNAINPSLIVLRGQLGYQFDGGNQLLAAIEQSVWGQDSPVGTDVVFGFRVPLERAPARERANHGLEQYTLDAKVVKTNDRLNLVKIDKGSNDGVAVGQIFDVYSLNEDGSVRDAVARCQVVSVKPDEAALSVTEYFKEVWINEGFVAKRVAQ